MDQIKIGAFLKELRKEKELTQEQLAEELSVSGRTISRWETGSNMPDISMLVVLADFYEVSIPEIIAGERKSENMNGQHRYDSMFLQSNHIDQSCLAMPQHPHYDSELQVQSMFQAPRPNDVQDM